MILGSNFPGEKHTDMLTPLTVLVSPNCLLTVLNCLQALILFVVTLNIFDAYN